MASGEQVGNMADIRTQGERLEFFTTIFVYYLLSFCVFVMSQNNHKNNLQVIYCGGIGTLVHGYWQCTMLRPLWKTVWWFLKN